MWQDELTTEVAAEYCNVVRRWYCTVKARHKNFYRAYLQIYRRYHFEICTAKSSHRWLSFLRLSFLQTQKWHDELPTEATAKYCNVTCNKHCTVEAHVKIFYWACFRIYWRYHFEICTTESSYHRLSFETECDRIGYVGQIDHFWLPCPFAMFPSKVLQSILKFSSEYSQIFFKISSNYFQCILKLSSKYPQISPTFSHILLEFRQHFL